MDPLALGNTLTDLVATLALVARLASNEDQPKLRLREIRETAEDCLERCRPARGARGSEL